MCVVVVFGFWTWANQPPRAQTAVLFAESSRPVAVVLSADDPDGDPLSFELLEWSGKGQLSGAPPWLTYTPPANFVGTERFSFRVVDPYGAFDIGFVEIRIGPALSALRVLPQLPQEPGLLGFVDFLVAQGIRTLYVSHLEPKAFAPGILPFFFVHSGTEAEVFVVGPGGTGELRRLGALRDHCLLVDMRQAPPGTYFFLVLSGSQAFAYPFRLIRLGKDREFAYAG
ncbi:MAG: Ig-like domain-containing protein [Candidatus Bipolaricaulota bacterium]|nr:Ig-like domain-containing protein [Candidatus Bipolaricaulota bacterium]